MMEDAQVMNKAQVMTEQKPWIGSCIETLGTLVKACCPLLVLQAQPDINSISNLII
jgi:hypothetical protein